MANLTNVNIVISAKSPKTVLQLGYIAGITKREGTPSKMRFFVADRLTGKILASGKSNSDGTFKRFISNDYVIDKQCFVMTFDDQGVYNAQVSDLINSVT